MWVMATFGRPLLCQRALDSVIEAGCSTPGIVVVDGDPDSRYRELRLPEGWRIEYRPENRGFMAALAWVFATFPDEPWYGTINDDMIVKTREWDKKVVPAAGRLGFASCDDGWLHDKRMCGTTVFGGDMLRAIGWWAPPGLFHAFSDDTWETLARALGNWSYRGDALVEHEHVFNGRAAADATHKRSYGRMEEDRAVFEGLRKTEIPQAVERVRQAMAQQGSMLSLELAKSRSLLICVPIGRQPAAEFVISLANSLSLLMAHGIRHECRFVIGSSNIPLARNQLAAELLISDFTDLLFIDDDMSWRPDAILRLLASEHDLIAAVGRKRVDLPNSDPGVWCVKWLGDRFEQDPMGAIKVAGVGTGFMRISRRVFETMIAKRPGLERQGELVRGQKTYHRFFYWGDDGTRILAEDFQFCADWRALGEDVWIDPKIEMGHVGARVYRGCVEEILMPAAELAEAAD